MFLETLGQWFIMRFEFLVLFTTVLSDPDPLKIRHLRAFILRFTKSPNMTGWLDVLSIIFEL